MNDVINLCPYCLAELPDDYPYDHVAIDLTLANRPELFGRMDRGERREVIAEGRRRGMPDWAIALHLNRSMTQIQRTASDDWVDRRRHRPHPHDDIVRELWQQNLTNAAIARRTGLTQGAVTTIRYRLGLRSRHQPGGPRESAPAVAA